MPFVPVDINQIKLDAPETDYLTQLAPDQPKGGFAPVDINKLKMDVPQPSVGMDVAKSVGSSMAQGALGVPLGFGDLGNQLVSGPQFLGRGVAEGVDKLIGIQPQPRGDIWQPFYGSNDAVKDLGIDYEPQTTAGKLATIPAQLGGALLAGKGLNAAANSAMNTPKNSGESFLRNNSSEPAVKTPTASNLRDTGSNLFQKSEQMGGVLWPKITDSWVDDSTKILPQTQAGKTVLGATPTTKLVDRMQSLKGQPLSLQAAMEIDSALGDEAAIYVDPKTGKLLAEGNKIRQIQQSLRDKIENAGPGDLLNKQAFDTWKEAKDNWAASYRMNDIERIMSKAQYSDNPVTIMRNGFKNLVTNKANLYGYTDEEIDALKHAAKTGIVTGALKTLGGRLISGATGMTAGAIGGGAPGAILGTVAGEAVGFPMRATANAMQRNRANIAKEVIAKRVQK